MQLLQDEQRLRHKKIANSYRDRGKTEVLDGLGHFRLFGSQKLPELRPMDAENDDPTSLGVVTLRS